MSFLDNLENSLKNLESREERDPAEQQRREENRARDIAAAPWAERMKNSAYTAGLLEESAAMGHRLRSKIYMAWLDSNLRLEAKGHVCEIRPKPDGIEAHYQRLSDGSEKTEPIDLQGDPKVLLQKWLFD